jgi:beta-lactamase class A
MRRKVSSALALLALLAVPLPAFSADDQSEPIAVSSLDASLLRHLSAIVGQAPGRIGVGIYELDGDRELSINGEHAFPMASTVKIAVAATYLQGVDEGRLRLDDTYPLLVSTGQAGADGRVISRPGVALTAQSLIELMITRSNNQATDALLAAVGGPAAVTAWLRNAGIEGQRVDRNIATLLRDDMAMNDPTLGIDKRDSSTPKAMVRLLAKLYKGDVLSPSSRGVLLGAMSRCLTGRNRIPAGLPLGTLVAHKTGTLYGQTSDVGIIRMPDGRAVALAVFATGRERTHAARASKIAEITRTVYDSFNVQWAGNQVPPSQGLPVPTQALVGTPGAVRANLSTVPQTQPQLRADTLAGASYLARTRQSQSQVQVAGGAP